MRKLLRHFLIISILCLMVVSQIKPTMAKNMSIEIANIKTGDKFEPCQDILVTFNTSLETGSIDDIRLYRNTAYAGRARREPYEITWKNAFPGYFGLSALLTDDSGNEAWSDTVYIIVGNVEDGDLISNGEFECSLSPWSVNNYEGAIASWNLDEPENWLSEGNLLTIEIDNAGSQIYNIQLAQTYPIKAGHMYELFFAADADAPKSIQAVLQEANDPWTLYWQADVTIDGPDTYGPFEFDCQIDDPTAALRFNLAGNTTTVYLDAIQLFDLDVEFASVDNKKPSAVEINEFSLSQNYPNPFNSTTMLRYAIPENARINIEIFNLMGQHVRTLVNGIKNTGLHQVFWDGLDDYNRPAVSGIYFYRLTAKAKSKTLWAETRKLILLE